MESLQPQDCEVSLPRQSPSPQSSFTATTARSTASTALSTLATSVRASTMSHVDREDLPRDASQPHASPTVTILDLVSDTATSSALPQPFGFSVSHKGRMLAVFSTKNIWLVQVEKLPRTFMRTLELRRRPVAVEVLDDGSLLAVLATPHKVDVYSLGPKDAGGIEKKRSIVLTADATSLALSPDGLVVATGYEYGIELVSLADHATEANRRTINCEPMDFLSFSDDGRTLLASSSARNPRPSTVFSVHGAFDGPFTEDGELILQAVDVAWTSQILFPDTATTAKQATLLPDSTTGQINDLFAYDSEKDAWGIYDIAGAQFTETKIIPPGDARWMRAESLQDTKPAVNPRSDHVAVAVKQHDSSNIWIYRLPDGSESGACSYTKSGQHPLDNFSLSPCSSVMLQKDEATSALELSVMRWLTPTTDSSHERLLSVGNVTWNTTPDTPVMPGDSAKVSGVLIMMDFGLDRPPASPEPPEKMTIDLDELLPGEKLPEEEIAFEQEVELVRTRTVAQRRGEAARAAARHRQSMMPPSSASVNQAAAVIPSMPIRHSSSDNEDGEVQVMFEEPYSHGQPRSQVSLHRAATVAANSPANRRHLRALPSQPLEFRRADGMREFPHESDADNWVPPPPPYTARADPPGPGALSISLTGPPPGFVHSPDRSPPAQHSALPRLHIPGTSSGTSSTSFFPVSAPAERGSASAHPGILPNRRNSDYMQPDSLPRRPLSAMPRRRPLPSSQSTGPTGSRRSSSAPAMQGLANLDGQYLGNNQPSTTAPAPSPDQLEALQRRESMPAPRPRGALGALGISSRAAASADDLGRFSRARRWGRSHGDGRRSRPFGGVTRLATIRSTNDRTSGQEVRGESQGRRRGGRQERHFWTAVETDQDVEKVKRKIRCVVM